MTQNSMTALVSAFARAYHNEQYPVRVFTDPIARQLFSDEEYQQIAAQMTAGIGFFQPGFSGPPAAALRWVVDQQLSPSPLGRSAFGEKALEKAVSHGTRQYLILGAGYDTFAYRQPAWAQPLQIFELDHPATAQDKSRRLAAAGIPLPPNVHFLKVDFTQSQWAAVLHQHPRYRKDQVSFCSLLGVAYYLSPPTFTAMVASLSTLMPLGSTLVLDYPDENSYTSQGGERAQKQALLAAAAQEKMLASYAPDQMAAILASQGFTLSEQLTPAEITSCIFGPYNQAQPEHPLTAFDHVNYCLAVKRK